MCKKEELVTLEISIHDLEYLSHVLSCHLGRNSMCKLNFLNFDQKLILAQKLDEFIFKYYEKDCCYY